MNNGGTSKLFIDFSPSASGIKGQIVRFLHDLDEIEVIADSFDEYLEMQMKDMTLSMRNRWIACCVKVYIECPTEDVDDTDCCIRPVFWMKTDSEPYEFEYKGKMIKSVRIRSEDINREVRSVFQEFFKEK